MFATKITAALNPLRCKFFQSRTSLLSNRAKRGLSAQQQTKPAEHDIADDKSMVQIDPLKHPDYFGVRNLFTVRELFDARVHLGHKEGTLNEYMAPYILGSRLGQLIIDLDQTVIRMREALNITAHIAYRGGLILFVHSPRETGHIVELAAKEVGEYSHCRQFNLATFMNSEAFFDSVTRMPDLVIFTNTMNNVFTEHVAVRDAAKLLIPTIGVVDTPCDPTLITYPVPGNDDSPTAIKLYCKLFKDSILLGKARRKVAIEKYGTISM